MGKLRIFFYVFVKSLTSINYYKEVVKTPVSFSFKYFFVLALAVSIVTTVRFVAELTPKIEGQIDRTINSAIEGYPENLEINVINGTLSTNLEEPLIIPMDKDNQTEEIQNLLVLDTQGTIEDLNNYKTLILVNSSNIIARKEGGGVDTYPLTGFPDTNMSREILTERSEGVRNLAKYIPYILFVFLLIAIFFYNFVYRTIYLFFPTLILLLVGKAKQLKIDFSDYYQIALHTLTLPLVVEVTLAAFGISLPVPFWFFAANLILGLIVVFKLSENNESTGSVAHAESPQV